MAPAGDGPDLIEFNKGDDALVEGVQSFTGVDGIEVGLTFTIASGNNDAPEDVCWLTK